MNARVIAGLIGASCIALSLIMVITGIELMKFNLICQLIVGIVWALLYAKSQFER